MKALEILKEMAFKSDNGVLLDYRGKPTAHIKQAIAELEALQAPKTCETCKFFEFWGIELPSDNYECEMGNCTQNITSLSPEGQHKDFGCIYYEPKE